MASNGETIATTGAFSDGRSAASSNVDVRLSHDGVAFHSSAVALTIWPYSDLNAAEPLTTHSEDCLLGSVKDPDATLYISNKQFVQDLADRAPQLSAYASRIRAARPWIWTAAAVTGLVLTAWAADISPARTVANFLPESTRVQFGENVIASLARNAKTCSTPDGDRALQKITERLLVNSDKDRRFTIRVLNLPVVNAFAVPGEQIVLTRQLLAQASGGDEIAGIIAHEMGHGIERDPEVGFIRALGLTAAIQFMTGGGTSNLANIGLLLAQLSYSRRAERAADNHAIRLSKQAQISLDGLKTFFQRMQGKEKKRRKSVSRSTSFLRSHPMTDDRLQAFDAVETYPTRPTLTDNEWQSLKAICGNKPKKQPKKAKPERDA